MEFSMMKFNAMLYEKNIEIKANEDTSANITREVLPVYEINK